MNFVSIFKAIYTGEGIGRVLMNIEIARSLELSGTVLDIGGRGQPSYRQLLRSNVHRFIVLDVMQDETVDIVGSVTRLPIASNCVDFILCFNVLEHIFDYTSALLEIRRVLKSGGVLYGRVPFLFGVHADPHDYWRYTQETLIELLAKTGFTEISIRVHGGLFLVIFNLLNPVLKFGILRVIGAGVAVVMDYILSKVAGEARNQERYPMGYFFIAR